MRKLRILALNPYGQPLGDWNHRLQRTYDKLKEKCTLKVFGKHIAPSNGVDNLWQRDVQELIKDFKPDLLYVSGFLIAEYCIRETNQKIVYDMGTYITRHLLLDNHKLTYKDMRDMSTKELRSKAEWGYSAIPFRKEDYVINNVDEIIIWEGEEADLVRKIHPKSRDKINEVSMVFYDLPNPINWKDKKDRVIAIAAKWGKRAKNGRLLHNVSLNIKNKAKTNKDYKKYSIHSVGHSGNWQEFMDRDKLMDELNKSKVLFCPYISGGCGVVNEGLKLGCNVIVGDWYPYLNYINKELIINSSGSGRIVSRSVNMIQKAMEKYYPPRLKLPKEEEQINKIIEICERTAKS